MPSGQFFAFGWCTASGRHGSLSALGRERRVELCACCTGRFGPVLVRFLRPSHYFLISSDILLVGGWAPVIIVIVGRSEPGTCSFIEIVVMSTITVTRAKHR